MAHDYRATVLWTRDGAVFTDNRYSRGHVWTFDGGIEVPGSSAPSSVRLPYSVAEAVDPEEALVASVASCHMLSFLDFAAKAGFMVDRYEDAARRRHDQERGRQALGLEGDARARDRPLPATSGRRRADVDDAAPPRHEECFIANSVKSRGRRRCRPSRIA